MLRSTVVALKKGWTHNPGQTRRGGKNLAWRPKIRPATLDAFVPLTLVHPRRHPNSWHARQFNLLGYTTWPKEIGFYNAGDNFEITPETAWKLYEKCSNELFWTKLHNEKTIIIMIPKVEKEPDAYMSRVNHVFRHHLKRFGADHFIYNAVMQAAAFAKDFALCEQLFKEMDTLGLEPNAQTYVNMMLAAKLCGLPRDKCEAYFVEGIQKEMIPSVLRIDTEFQMWMDQLDRLGSFTSGKGYLSVNEEGAKPMPKDMFALWGWHRSESKFVSRDKIIKEQVRSRVHGGKEMVGTVFTKALRRPWALYNGMLPFDFRGPAYRRPTSFKDAPSFGTQRTGKAY
ncbi:hypothetical protein STCU_02572 [Strigomonas culicis]|uniref:Mitochondrial RNA binding complex 1 subunit n=3 Tax=Strigomonas culicis TaxID=28005 RepID=S9V7E4_9TRYP|nr:hypothetical protein STCU_08086 [Strigomonas culicis]EPY32928.1 hypothetical protein STCU_02572 [Strigomonas culicis]|eukprot:EPY22871.1 hypothetical protein STCU_08086 [Strigomonas culicis]